MSIKGMMSNNTSFPPKEDQKRKWKPKKPLHGNKGKNDKEERKMAASVRTVGADKASYNIFTKHLCNFKNKSYSRLRKEIIRISYKISSFFSARKRERKERELYHFKLQTIFESSS